MCAHWAKLFTKVQTNLLKKNQKRYNETRQKTGADTIQASKRSCRIFAMGLGLVHLSVMKNNIFCPVTEYVIFLQNM